MRAFHIVLLCVNQRVIIDGFAIINRIGVLSCRAIKHLYMRNRMTFKQSQMPWIYLDAPFMTVRTDLLGKLVVVVSHQATAHKLRSLPSKGYMTVAIIGASEVQRWFTIVVHNGGIDQVVGIPGGNVTNDAFHMVVVGSRAHDLVIKEGIAFNGMTQSAVAIDIETFVFSRHCPLQLDVRTSGNCSHILGRNHTQTVVGYGISGNHTILRSVKVKEGAFAVFVEMLGKEVNAFAIKVEAWIPTENDLGVGWHIQFGFVMGTFINGEPLRRHIRLVISNLQLAAFGAIGRIRSQRELDSLIIADDGPCFRRGRMVHQ